ncbi:mitochondrial fission ELM1 family protein [Luteibacter sp. PPL201]|uniref:Mitochondrial fission ELM1 family protein n=1 Tax=Luteibacter sahnii TaxID=3021977 RepID=A0ABT6BFA3_9GAMM|nr:mitochondrial fission ELM1 family protein [Luteibacter sp. PPL193]MDY1549166.1 mitochondrial fission ELM1 family protein [Luteibacter sp. PPL193]
MSGRATPSCWVLTDGAAGNRRQALALAEALTPSIREVVVELRPPWSWVAPRLLAGGQRALGGRDDSLLPPWPTLAIGCGRAAAWATRQLRRWSGGRTLAVQILDPRIDTRHWDLVIAPRHDGLVGPNVLTPLGSLHPIDGAWLADARAGFAGFAELPSPRLGVLIGGDMHGRPVDAAATAGFLEAVKARHAHDGGSVLAVTSRRTPADHWPMIRAAFAGVPGFVWTSSADGANPYPGILGWADRLAVTPDSVNMLSEACATGRPVHTHLDHALPAKLARFHAELRATRRLHDMDAITPEQQEPLREAVAIAEKVRMHLGLGS